VIASSTRRSAVECQKRRGSNSRHHWQCWNQEIHVKTLDGLLDTRALGKMAPLVIGLLTGLAEVEREMIRERTQESVEHRRRTGGDLGGRPGLAQVKKDHILKLREDGHSLRSIKTLTGVSLSAVQRTCAEARVA
jgi:DNA invertase Pin-like site-specific DNA recombinase